jgi:hypothetical protein
MSALTPVQTGMSFPKPVPTATSNLNFGDCQSTISFFWSLKREERSILGMEASPVFGL